MTENQKANANTVSSVVPVEGSRIDDVEKDVKRLKADVEGFMDLKNAVDDLKNTIVDIRALISEAQSPFNLLQLITNEDDLNKVIQAKPIIEKKLQAGKSAEAHGITIETKEATHSETPETVASEVCDDTKAESAGFSLETTVDAVETEKTSATSPLTDLSSGGLEKDTSLVQWVYMMLDLGFDEDSIRKVCDFCEFSGFMPKGYGGHVANLVGAIVKARSRNLTPEEMTLTIYCAADAVGVETSPKDLKKLLINVLKRDETRKVR
jgi:hypothetical protein